MKTINIKKLKGCKVVAIISAENWFNTDSLYNNITIRLNDFVVCEWYDFHDGINSHIEAKQTIAICRKKEDAELIFNSK